MKFKVLNQQPTKPEGFYIEVQFMFGDADGYTEEIVGPFSTADFDRATEFIEWVESLSNYGRQGGTSYEAHRWDNDDCMPDNSAKYLYDFGYDLEDKPEMDPIFRIEWPNDPQADYQYHAAMDGWKAYFINELGQKHNVEVVK